MSGVTGAERVRNRKDFVQFIDEYRDIVKKFPGFKSLTVTGSFNSDPNKDTFGDIDLIMQVDTINCKKLIKLELDTFFKKLPMDMIVPFTSEKHFGKRTSNTGELVSVRFHSKVLGYSVQIDNIIALSEEEVEFKCQFLNMPAEKQGLLLGLVKIVAIEKDVSDLLSKLKIVHNPDGWDRIDNEYEFSLSSTKLELRWVKLNPFSRQGASHDVVWTSQDWNDVVSVLSEYDLSKHFDQLIIDVKNTIKNPRSARRITGLFKSMITVKSGEIGTPKAMNKEAALSKIFLCLT